MTAPVVVWDDNSEPSAVVGSTLCWQSYHQHGSISSIPQYLEDNAERLRAKYLSFIHELGDSRFGGRRVIEHLDMGGGFSFWWMTSLAEKSPFKSPRIYDCLRLLALEEILVTGRPTELLLMTSDGALVRAVRRLCENLGIRFRTRSSSRPPRKYSLRKLYGALPSSVQGLLSIRHLLFQLPLRKLKRSRWFAGEDSVLICSYFIHLDPMLCARGIFHSRQWEELPKLLASSGRLANWIQLFMLSKAVPDLATGIRWLEKFNLDARNQGVHRFLQSYFGIGMLLRVLWSWAWLNIVGWRLRGIQSAFKVSGSAVWLWPILRADWLSSMSGPVALSNCVWLALFDAALADIPHQKTGLYLCENQAWEKALLRAWRRYGHGKIIGVQHATAPFWHLYYFDDRRSLARSGVDALPLPDLLAVNGAAAGRAFENAGYPADRLVEVEALRYLHLSQAVAKGVRPSAAIRVIVLGDMIAASMDQFMDLLEKAAALLPAGYEFTLKPHPGYRVELARYPGLRAEETNEALGGVLCNYDIALAANGTSAAVDAYIAGLPVIVVLNGDSLNLSPLRGEFGVSFVSTAEQLIDAVVSANLDNAPRAADSEKFFFLDTDLARWKRLLQPSRH